ncbi:MAG: hypothetical protein DRN06_09270, partial [Thermoprotei archaeon]
PRQIQVNTPTRPPAEAYVRPLGPRELSSVAEQLRERLEGVEVISWHPAELVPGRPEAARLGEVIVATLERRPCRFHELCAITGADPASVRAELDRLMSEGLLATRDYEGQRFYTLRRRP